MDEVLNGTKAGCPAGCATHAAAEGRPRAATGVAVRCSDQPLVPEEKFVDIGEGLNQVPGQERSYER
jgi:hypothetical protein